MNLSDIFHKENCPEFLKDASNVYRTRYYIVKQEIGLMSSVTNDNVLISNDTFYLRTPKRDAEYERIFRYKTHLNGKRLPSSTYTRKYVD